MAELDSNPALSGSIAYILSAPSPENITANLDLSNIGDSAHSFLVVSLSYYTYQHLAQSRGAVSNLMFGGKIPKN